MERVTVINNKALVPDSPGRYVKLPVQPYKPQSKLTRLAQKALTCCFGKQWTPVVVGEQKCWVKIDHLVEKFGCNKRSLQKLKQPLDLQMFARKKTLQHSTPQKPKGPSEKIVRQAAHTYLKTNHPGANVSIFEPKQISQRIQALSLEAKLPQVEEKFAYTQLQILGTGAFKSAYNGIVIKASGTGQAMAIVTVRNPKHLGEMLKENEIAKLFGPNDHVVAPAIHVVWISKNTAILIMPLYDGDAKETSPQENLGVALGAAKGLAALHREGYVHRDLKPENVFRKDGKGYIADLGLIAKGKYVPLSGNLLSRAPETFIIREMTPATDV